MWERTITIGSAGKTYSVTGWKVMDLVRNCFHEKSYIEIVLNYNIDISECRPIFANYINPKTF